MNAKTKTLEFFRQNEFQVITTNKHGIYDAVAIPRYFPKILEPTYMIFNKPEDIELPTLKEIKKLITDWSGNYICVYDFQYQKKSPMETTFMDLKVKPKHIETPEEFLKDKYGLLKKTITRWDSIESIIEKNNGVSDDF
jgi:hypothetical protein